MHNDTVPEAPPMRLAMTMLGVRDLDASIGFYTERVGMKLSGRITDFVFLDAGGATICLSAEKAPQGDGPLNIPVELVLAVSSVRATYDRLIERGVEFVSQPHPVGGGSHVAHFRDPDGHLFSLYGAP
jgi:catechol 2,3-dioxygenase-like lactoylglutathione lyase family enzyme